MRTYTLRGNEIPHYLTLNETLHLIEKYCFWWHFEDEHSESNPIHYWRFDFAARTQEAEYKFIETKAKRIIEERYVAVVVWNNYGVDNSRLGEIIEDYLKITNQEWKN